MHHLWSIIALRNLTHWLTAIWPLHHNHFQFVSAPSHLLYRGSWIIPVLLQRLPVCSTEVRPHSSHLLWHWGAPVVGCICQTFALWTQQGSTALNHFPLTQHLWTSGTALLWQVICSCLVQGGGPSQTVRGVSEDSSAPGKGRIVPATRAC